MKKKSNRKGSKILITVFSLIIILLSMMHYINAIDLTEATSPLVAYMNFENKGLGDSSITGINDGHIVCSMNTCNENDILTTKATFPLAKYGDGFYISSKYAIALPDSARVGSGSFTIMAWINPDINKRSSAIGTQSNIMPIISEYNDQINGKYVLGVNNQNVIFSYNMPGTKTIKSPNDAYNKQWLHAAITFDNDKKILRMYIDGVLVVQKKDEILSQDENNYRLLIGANDFNSRTLGTINELNIYGGIIDEVKIFNYALTQDSLRSQAGYSPTCKKGDYNDADCDGRADNSDNCKSVPNPGQADIDVDGTGDACEQPLYIEDIGTPSIGSSTSGRVYRFEDNLKEGINGPGELSVYTYDPKTRSGIKYSDGKMGKALLIDGSSAAVQLTDSTQRVSGLSKYTLGVSAYLDAPDDNFYPLITERSERGTKYLLYMTKDRVMFEINGVILTANGNYDKKWTSIIAVVDNTINEKVKLYVNGELKDTKNEIPASTTTDELTYKFLIGTMPTSKGQLYFPGKIDQLQLYGTSLTNEQAIENTRSKETICNDNIDNNENNLIDCLDSDCANDASCTTTTNDDNTDCDNTNGETCIEGPADGTCEALGGIACSGECGGQTIPSIDSVTGINCCAPNDVDPLSVECVSTEYISALGASIQVSRTPCIDEDGDGEGYSLVSVPQASGIVYFESLGVAEDQLSSNNGESSYKEPCTTLPKGANPGTVVNFYGYGGIIITLVIILVYYLLTRKTKKKTTKNKVKTKKKINKRFK
ncbi:LamG domain-containing protein [Candidatus Woesearchaeota archaeon]|nr:LamG domain-containing protein [Candidatus Woesearchaeota archaeon]